MSLIALLADAADEAGTGAFPPFDPTYFPSQLFWLAISFGGLYFILARMILPRLGGNLERRSDAIADDLDEAARLNEQAVEAKEALETKLAQAKAKSRETSAKTEAEIAKEVAEATREVDAKIGEKLEAAEARISELRQKAMANVEDVASEATSAILAKLGGPESDAAVRKAVRAVIGNKA